MPSVCGYKKYKSNARGLEYSKKITEAVLKKLLELVDMPLVQVAIRCSVRSCIIKKIVNRRDKYS
jgi:hypothetical protein